MSWRFRDLRHIFHVFDVALLLKNAPSILIFFCPYFSFVPIFLLFFHNPRARLKTEEVSTTGRERQQRNDAVRDKVVRGQLRADVSLMCCCQSTDFISVLI
jgi:hypothetical protein